MNPFLLRRWVLRAGVVLLGGFVVWLVTLYGIVRVPAGMDTLPGTHPPGTICFVRRSPRRISLGEHGAVVFLRVPGGGTVLTRVIRIDERGMLHVRHDNRRSRLLRYEDMGPFPVDAVAALVLTQLVPEGAGNGG